mgnify:CR=1 FL=1
MMKIYLYIVCFLLNHRFNHCVQPYFPPQITFFANGDALYAIDEINQQAYLSWSYSVKASKTGYAFQHAPFTTPDSPQSKNYIQLLEGFPNIGCIYSIYWNYTRNTFDAFPSHWTNGTKYEIKNFINFKYPMIKSNSSSVYEDYWYSNETCHPQSPKPVPCEEIYFRKGTDIPVRSTQVLTEPWETKQYTINYLVLSTGKPDEKYFNSISKDWTSTCRDVSLGISYDPQSAKIDTHQSVDIKLWLFAPPHRINDNDTTIIQWKLEGCDDCLTYEPKQISFNSHNFQEKQVLKITRVKNGSPTILRPIFNGGGYDLVPTNNYTLSIQ